MPYVLPTADELQVRFPAFAAVADATVTAALAEASGRVDTTWIEADYQPAIMLYAAHVMTMDGLGTGAEAAAAAGGTLGIKSYRSGTFAVERGEAAMGGGAYGSLESTSYGRRFLEILRRNHPPIFVVTSLANDYAV